MDSSFKKEVFKYGAMGTIWEISIWQRSDEELSEQFIDEIKKEIISRSEEFENIFSRFIKTSLVWKISESVGVYEVPSDFIEMLNIYFNLYESSGFKLNPLIGFTISDLGYDIEYTLNQKDEVRKTPDLFDAVKIIDSTHMEVKEKVLFDFGALGKGYFVDKIAEFLKTKLFESSKFIVNGSGDIYYFGDSPIEVGLENPHDETMVVGSTFMKTGAMCASGINQRKWREHHHVIDPIKNKSTDDGIVATWVIAEKAVIADAIASCLFFTAPENITQYNFEYVVMNDSNRIKKSEGFTLEPETLS